MAEFERLSFDGLCDRLAIPAKTLLLMHTSPDADTLGSCLALSELLTAAGSEVYCICGDDLPEYLYFLSDGQRSLEVPEGFVPERVIAVDVAAPSQLGKLRSLYEEKVDLMIDHHGAGTVFADHYVDPHAAATGEIIFAIARELLNDGILYRIPDVFWTYCYAAISADTGGFRYSNTTPATMRCGASLLECGVDAAEINRQLFSQKSYRQLQAERVGFDRLHLYADGRISVITMPYDTKIQNGFSDGDLGTLIDVARSVRGVQVAAVIKQHTPEHVYRVGLRSETDAVSVADIAAGFGGGGHIRAAGCAIAADSAEEAEGKLIASLENIFGNFEKYE